MQGFASRNLLGPTGGCLNINSTYLFSSQIHLIPQDLTDSMTLVQGLLILQSGLAAEHFFFFLTPLRDGSLVCYWANGPEQYFEVVENAISRSQIFSSHCVCLSLRVGGMRCNNLSFTSYV